EIADPIGGADGGPRRVGLDAEDELRARQDPSQHTLDPLVEGFLPLPVVIEREQLVELRRRYRTPIGPACDAGDHLARTVVFRRTARSSSRPADEEAPTAWRIPGARGVERPRDRHRFDVRTPGVIL